MGRQYEEAKHRRDTTGKFSVGGGGGAARKRRLLNAGDSVVGPDNKPRKLVGRTKDGRIVTEDADGVRRADDAAELRPAPSAEDYARLHAVTSHQQAQGGDIARRVARGDRKGGKARLKKIEAANRKLEAAQVDAANGTTRGPDGKKRKAYRSTTRKARAAAMSSGGRSLSAAARGAAAARGIALKDGKLPIRNRKELKAAIGLRNNVEGHTAMEIRRHITKRAKALNATDMLPDAWRRS